MLWILILPALLLGAHAAPVSQQLEELFKANGNLLKTSYPTGATELDKALILSYKVYIEDNVAKEDLIREFKQATGISETSPNPTQKAVLKYFSLVLDYSFWVKGEVSKLNVNNQKHVKALFALFSDTNFYKLSPEQIKAKLQKIENYVTTADREESKKLDEKASEKYADLKIQEAFEEYYKLKMNEVGLTGRK